MTRFLTNKKNEMERQEIIDKLDALYDEADKNNIGLNETELEYKENVADWIESLVKKFDIGCVSNSMLINWWYLDENSTEVTVIGIVDKWCVVEDNEHDEPYCIELEYVRQMYIDSIDC